MDSFSTPLEIYCKLLLRSALITYKCITPPQGGYSGFQVTEMIEWSQKSKPKKIPGPKLNPKKIPCRFSGP